MIGKAKRQPLSRDEFDEILKRAEKGDVEALVELRTLMRADPKTWRLFGDLTEHAKQVFLDLMVKENVIGMESLKLEIESVTNELRQGSQSTLRRLLIDQILLLWLDVHYQQTMAARPSETKAETEFRDKRLERTRKRYFDALAELGRMDRILGLAPPRVKRVETTEHKDYVATKFTYDDEL